MFFSVNEKNHGVKSSFKSSLEGYTMQISADKNSEEYRKMEAQAVKTAEEIVASKRTNNNKPCVKLENGEQDDCICNRQKCFVICRICGSYEASTRVRRICSIHPSMYLEFLDEEIVQCRYRLVMCSDFWFTKKPKSKCFRFMYYIYLHNS